ncbi:MAG: translation elongation factor-like protein [Kiritimatiellae bacterium]|nr:translation elongation factor-like protein [Kiritimatiellia bacterium]
MAEVEIGFVTHYFNHINVAAIKMTGDLVVGDTIHVVGHTTDVTCQVESMQVEHASVEKAGKGDSIGIKVPDHVREHDKVFKVTP